MNKLMREQGFTRYEFGYSFPNLDRELVEKQYAIVQKLNEEEKKIKPKKQPKIIIKSIM